MRYLLSIVLFFLYQSNYAQHQEKVDFLRAEVLVHPMPGEKKIKGSVTYEFEVLSDVDSVFLDAKNMEFYRVQLNKKKARYAYNGKTISLYKKLKKDKKYQLTLEYSTQPKQTVYFIGWESSTRSGQLSDSSVQDHPTLKSPPQVWTQGQGKYTSHWLPSFDDMNEKVEFDLSIIFDDDYDVIANGNLQETKTTESLKTWSFDMKSPMSSYLLAFAIGDYERQELRSQSGISIMNYYYPKDSLKVEPTYRYTKKIFDFLENQIGISYPWQNYKQVPVRDFLYAGMENTGATIFSDGYIIDSVAFIDKNYVNVNAHELAHQWFGNLVTEANGNHHWLHEGFATYYAYLAEKELFGEDYLYWKLYESAKQLNAMDVGQALIDPAASSLTFYEKGAWALFMLREQVGDTAFREGIKNYLRKYRYRNATISNFLEEMELASEIELSDFEQLWLRSKAFPYEKAKAYLKTKSESLKHLLDLQWELTTSKTDKEQIIRSYWNTSTSSHLRSTIINQYHKYFSENFLKEAFETDDLEIRQALATSLEQIPVNLETEFESLLADASYVTIENALYKLWVFRPANRARYLETSKDIIGLPNKNVRLLWLLFAVLTKDYLEEDQREEYMTELLGYTSSNYPFEVRQNAFALITEVFQLPDQNLKDLVNASVHHAWQFRKFARTLLDKIIMNDKQKQRLEQLVNELNGEELQYIKRKLEAE